jgi:hypothetical protein
VIAPQLAGRTLGGPDGSFVIAEWTDEGGPPIRRDWSPRFTSTTGTTKRLVRPRRHAPVPARRRGGSRPQPDRRFSGQRGVPHTFWNPSEQPARYLLVMTPHTFRLIEELHASTDRDPATFRALYQRYDWTVDASVVALAERLGTTRIATLDRRHFGNVRPKHVAVFELLP